MQQKPVVTPQAHWILRSPRLRSVVSCLIITRMALKTWGIKAAARAWRLRLWPVLLGALAGCAWLSWHATRIVSQQSKTDHLLWLSTSLLRGISGLGEILLTPWFFAVVLLVLFFGSQVRAFLARITHVEVNSIKLDASVYTAPSLRLADAGWYDEAPSVLLTDVPGGDGFLLEKPDPSTPDYQEYQDCLQKTGPLLKQLSMQNQDTIGEELERLEWKWAGDYVEHLAYSLQHLRACIAEKRVTSLTNKYLSTAVLLRHVMLYLTGREAHFQQLIDDIEFLAREHATATLNHRYIMWLLLRLATKQRFAELQLVSGLPIMQDERCRFSRTAFIAYSDFRRGRFEEALGAAELALRWPEQRDAKAPIQVLRYTAAVSALQLDRPLDAIRHADLLLHEPVGAQRAGLLLYLQKGARRVVALACNQLNWHERLYALHIQGGASTADPFLLNALAVALAANGHKAGATQALQQAVRHLPEKGEDDLRKAVTANLRTLVS